MCTHRLGQPSKHKPTCIPPSHTHPKTYYSNNACKPQNHRTAPIAPPQPPAHFLFFVSCMHTHVHVHTHIPPQSLHIGISHLDPLSTSGPHQPPLLLPQPRPDTPCTPLACQPCDRNSPGQERSAEERGLEREEEWGKPCSLTYLYPWPGPAHVRGWRRAGDSPPILGRCGNGYGSLHQPAWKPSFLLWARTHGQWESPSGHGQGPQWVGVRSSD